MGRARISPWPLAGNRSCIPLGSRTGFVSCHYSLVRYSRTVTWKRLTKSPAYEATKLLYRPRAGSLIWFTIGLVSLSPPSSLSPFLSVARAHGTNYYRNYLSLLFFLLAIRRRARENLRFHTESLFLLGELLFLIRRILISRNERKILYRFAKTMKNV